MTVAELILELRKQPPDATVSLEEFDSLIGAYLMDVEEVRPPTDDLPVVIII